VRAAFLDIADRRDGRREPLLRSATRHGKAARTLTLDLSCVTNTRLLSSRVRRRGWSKQ
jgi:hypothetical protein